MLKKCRIFVLENPQEICWLLSYWPILIPILFSSKIKYVSNDFKILKRGESFRWSFRLNSAFGANASNRRTEKMKRFIAYEIQNRVKSDHWFRDWFQLFTWVYNWAQYDRVARLSILIIVKGPVNGSMNGLDWNRDTWDTVRSGINCIPPHTKI